MIHLVMGMVKPATDCLPTLDCDLHEVATTPKRSEGTLETNISQKFLDRHCKVSECGRALDSPDRLQYMMHSLPSSLVSTDTVLPTMAVHNS